MRGRTILAAFALAGLAGIGSAGAEGGNFFKNLFDGRGEASSSPAAPWAMDPDDTYCPQVDIVGGGAAVRSFAGSAGDGTHLHHQLGFGQLGRECTARPDGSVSVKVGVQVRALLGPAGKPGRFEVPLTIALTFDDQVLASRSRRVAVAVPAGAAQATTSVVEDELIVPPAKAVGYDIVVSLAGSAARGAGQRTAKTGNARAKPAAADGPASAGQ